MGQNEFFVKIRNQQDGGEKVRTTDPMERRSAVPPT